MIMAASGISACTYNNYAKVCVFDDIEQISEVVFSDCSNEYSLSSISPLVWENEYPINVGNCDKLSFDIKIATGKNFRYEYYHSSWPFEDKNTDFYSFDVDGNGDYKLNHTAYFLDGITSCQNIESATRISR